MASVIERVSGNAQTAVATREVPDSLVVRVLDDRGYPVPHAVVVWSGDGYFAWEDTTYTDRDGYAATRWLLGAEFGTNQAVASVEGVGHVTFTAMAVPVRVLADLHAIAVGDDHACGLDAEGRAYCWTLDDPANAQPVLGNVRFWTISAGDDVTCGIGLDDRAYCWGSTRTAVWVTAAPNRTPSPVRSHSTLRSCISKSNAGRRAR